MSGIVLPEGLITPWGIAFGLRAAYQTALDMPASIERREVLNALHHALECLREYHEGSAQAGEPWEFGGTEHIAAPQRVVPFAPTVRANWGEEP